MGKRSDLHPYSHVAGLTGGRVLAHVPGAYPRLSCCGGSDGWPVESTPSVDADYPPARQPSANESLLLMRLIDRRKLNNVDQAIEFLNAAGRRAGDR